ncbi:TPA: hypothetical protein PTV74_003137 [Clostridium botulinum]|nr:hypothetical protein [Clostridium botulinum]EKS4395690.1 hypothetical protein [Clostridium botulinum]HDK7194830.1 hypothetical protein [Clostridium botulinum]HDK7206292.1 hypothetical protein [Clostridium botulinum]HDK7210028.1 hypothetical protein [Clostridium botulinum]
MFDKLKNKIKVKMIKWLELDTFKGEYKQYINDNEKDKYNLKNSINNTINNNYNEHSEQIDALNRTLKSVVSIGADVTRNNCNTDRSWAVVCIESKRANIVKFVDLQGQNYMQMLDFLKQFECSRRVIDAPCTQLFEDNFVFFNDK